jgi:hypothetical protein
MIFDPPAGERCALIVVACDTGVEKVQRSWLAHAPIRSLKLGDDRESEEPLTLLRPQILAHRSVVAVQ